MKHQLMIVIFILTSMLPGTSEATLCDSYNSIAANDLFFDYEKGMMKVHLPKQGREYVVTTYTSELREIYTSPVREIEVWDASTGTVLCYRQPLQETVPSLMNTQYALGGTFRL